jgi:hypothetical protein
MYAKCSRCQSVVHVCGCIVKGDNLLQRKLDIAIASLKRIETHPKCEWDIEKVASGDWKFVPYKYSDDYRNGHREAATIAREAREKIEEI